MLWLVYICFISSMVSSFSYFSPTVYGMESDLTNSAKLPNSTYNYLHWIYSWDL